MNPRSFIRPTCVPLLAAALATLVLLSGCGSSKPAAEAARYLSRGKARMDQREYERAVLEFRNAVRLQPNDAEPSYQLAVAYLNSGDYRAGVTALLHAVGLDPRHSAAQLKLEELRAGQEPGDLGSDPIILAERRQKAIIEAAPPGDASTGDQTPLADLERAFRRNPNNPEIQAHLVAAYMSGRHFSGAEKTLDRILEENDARRKRAARIALFEKWAARVFKTNPDLDQKEPESEDSPDDEAAALEKERKKKEEERQNREDARALIQRGQLYLATVRAREAEQDLIQAVAVDRRDALGHYLLSKVHLVHGAEFARRQELAETVELSESWLQARLELAASQTESGAARAAVDLLDKAPKSQQSDLALIAARNWALLALDERAAAQKSLDRAMAVQKTPEFLLQEGYLRLRMKDPAGARNSLEFALQSGPPDVRAVDALAETYWREKKPAIALATMEGYASRYPKSAGLQYLLGTWLVRLDRREDAKTAFRAAVQARPGFLAAMERLAHLDISDGRLDSARETIDSIAAAPGGGSTAELALGVMEERRGGNPNAAIAHYRKVLEESPDNITALNNLAYHLAADPSHADEALKLALQLKKLAPNRAAVDDTLGWAYYNTGAYELAAIYLQSALSQQNKPSRVYRLAMAYFKAGARERAHAALRDAMRLDPSAPEAPAAEQLINGPNKSGN